MIKNENVEGFYSIVKNVANSLDINLREEHRWSSADICFVSGDKFLIDGFGPTGAKPSKKSEYILKHSLIERATLLACVLLEVNKEIAGN